MNETLQQFITGYLLPALGLVLTGFAGWLSTVIIKFLTDRKADKKLENALKKAREALMTAVGAVMQAYVNKLKEKGEWTEETMEQARQDALIAAKLAMGPIVWKFLEEYLMTDGISTITQWCLLQIDALVEPVKKVRADRKLAEAKALQIIEACKASAG